MIENLGNKDCKNCNGSGQVYNVVGYCNCIPENIGVAESVVFTCKKCTKYLWYNKKSKLLACTCYVENSLCVCGKALLSVQSLGFPADCSCGAIYIQEGQAVKVNPLSHAHNGPQAITLRLNGIKYTLQKNMLTGEYDLDVPVTVTEISTITVREVPQGRKFKED